MSRLVRVLAILGGTFDPIHYGHLRLAADVKTALSLPEVRLIPAGDPPQIAFELNSFMVLGNMQFVASSDPAALDRVRRAVDTRLAALAV